jgi:hypothetical protein
MKQSHLIGLATPLLLSAGTLATAERFYQLPATGISPARCECSPGIDAQSSAAFRHSWR